MVESRCAIDEAGPVGAQCRHGVLEQGFGPGVDRAGGLIEYEQCRVGEEGAGDRDQLFLPGADVAALVVDHRVVAVGEAVDEPIDEGGLGRLEHLVLCRIRPAVHDVLADGAPEQPRVLEDHPDLRPQVGAAHL